MKKILLMSLVSLVFLGAVNAVPQYINFQGVLKDSSGNLLTGSYSIKFGIYNAASGGSDIWNETQTVSVEGGLYNVQLGSATALTDSVFTDSATKYLGIKVGSDNEMSPRVILVSVPYAYRAGKVDMATFESSSGDMLAAAITGHLTNINPGAYSAGVYGQNDGTGLLGIGVYGKQNGSGWGVGGEVTGATGTGVLGYAKNTTGANKGVWGITDSPNGYGVAALGGAAGGTGAALYVNGKIKVSGSAVGQGSSSWAGGWAPYVPVVGASFVTVTNSYVNTSSRIYVFPLAGAAPPAGLPTFQAGFWAVYAGTGNFTIFSSANEVAAGNPDFNYLIIN